MHVLFVHRNFPAQFGHLAGWLVEQLGWQCTFVSELPEGQFGGVRRIQYKPRGGATKRTHFANRPNENYTWHSHAVYETLKLNPEIEPDLIVGHSGFGSTCMLADLYDAPILNFFEWYYGHPEGEMHFRPEFPSSEEFILRSRIRNAAFLIDLESCARGYSPTNWQRSQFPDRYHSKIDILFDGIDTDFWYRHAPPVGKSRWVKDRRIPPGAKIVTYVSRGFESMRGFDIFMQVAKRICAARDDVVFVCVGSDRHCYGGDDRFTGGKPFREWVLSRDDYDLSRFLFTGSVPRLELVRLLGMSDLHIYLTVPFVLSWSLFNALACGCTVLGSNTPPVAEVVKHGENGLLADFYDIDGLTEQALRVLADPEAHRPLGQAGTDLIEREYSVTAIMPRMLRLYEETIAQYKAARGDREFRPAHTYQASSLAVATIHSAEAIAAPPNLLNDDERMTEIVAAIDAAGDEGEMVAAVADVPRLLAANSSNGNGNGFHAKRRRVLLAIAHYYRPEARGMYGSLREGQATRTAALRSCIAAWRHHFAGKQYIPSLATTDERPANEAGLCDVDIVVCTHRGDHLLHELNLPAGSWRCAARQCPPMELGYECQAVLREQLGRYDYYCYTEDDLIVHDPLWFEKLHWFSAHAGADCLLQPNRYELSSQQGVRKAYIDGDLPLEKTLDYQDIGDRWELKFDALGSPLRFLRPKNPHAGCYFLTAEQMERWARQPHFLDRNRSFYSALESAATLGIMRTFRVYKTAPEQAAFFEIEHAGDAWIRKFDERNRAAQRGRSSPKRPLARALD